MVVPALTDATSWRAPYWSESSLVASRSSSRPSPPRASHESVMPASGSSATADCFRSASCRQPRSASQSSRGNWVVPLLERQGASSTAAGLAGGLILLVGIATRPAGGLLAGRVGGRRIVVVGLLGTSLGALLLALGWSLAVSAVGALVLGLSGLPFAVIFAAAQRARPDAPGAAIALVNACAVLVVVVGTPLAGLAFELPSDGRLAFAVIAALGAATLIPLRATRL